MDIEEEFEVKRQALELMKGRTAQELDELRDKVKEASHKFDDDLERVLFQTQKQMQTLVDAATGEDTKQQAAVGDLEAAVERALHEGQEALRQFEEMKASRQMEFQTLRQAIDYASFDLDENLTATKKALRTTSEQMITYIKDETKTRVQRFEDLSVSVRNEFRGPR